MTDYVVIGRLTSPHGIQGWVKVLPMTDIPNRFEGLERVQILREGSTAPQEYEIEGVKYQTGRVLLKFKGIETRENAASFRGGKIIVDAGQVPPIDEKDTYYAFQLTGMSVTDEAGELIGKLEEIYSTGANDVYLVKGPDGKTEYFLPAIKKCILSVDVERKIMVINREFAV